ncbi:hypothetical protein GPECTOR_62g881 [Gonium pectorale]|uniref:Uncharacterized protein n=1 Tax=Gonium pectorale TaxID=33097 RepID=A0A150G4F9_GONPE|nr:hypothetical protein GPECTOR_62g881 [Gonium pectorale]|eukprot:KXZ44766.1 hypothetical protein GPECTOR_62g881 [Gonium pectorale]
MLREQQRECQALHSNPLFKEFRTPARQKKFGKGYSVIEEVGTPQPFADLKSIEYEGQARMFDLIKNTAIREEKPRQGVWASFGAPYVPLGDPRELEKTLPDLNRDKMGSREGQRNGSRRKNSKQAAQQAAQQAAAAAAQQQQQQHAAAAAAGADGSPRRRRQGPGSPGGKPGGGASEGATRPASQGSQGGYHSDSDSGLGVPSMYGATADEEPPASPAEAAIRAATREAEDTVNKQKSVMRFTVADRVEAAFPAAVLRGANVRAGRAKASVGAFVNRREAEEEASDPQRAYGQPTMVRRQGHLAPLPGPRGRGGRGGGAGTGGGGGGGGDGAGGEDSGDSSTFFLTQVQQQQGAAAQAAQDEERRHMSLENATTPVPHDPSGTSTAATGMTTVVGDGSFAPLVEPVVALRGDESNPVYKWHNDFMGVRHAGRQQLQAALYARAQGRAAVRTDSSAAAGLSTTLFGVLNLTQGRMPNFQNGAKVVSPYSRLEAYQAAQEAARRNTKQKAVQALEPAEIRILQRFYDQLCALVEVQRMSDPLCLMVVSKVKSLLEAGVYLHRPMLVAVVEHVASFAKGAGMMRYNKYLLAVLTFITKCVGLDVADLEEVVEQHGVSLVVYGTPAVPSKVTHEMVAALADEDGGGSGGGGGGRGPPAGAGVAVGRARSGRGAGAAQGQGKATSVNSAGGGGGGGGGSSASGGAAIAADEGSVKHAGAEEGAGGGARGAEGAAGGELAQAPAAERTEVEGAPSLGASGVLEG